MGGTSSKSTSDSAGDPLAFAPEYYTVVADNPPPSTECGAAEATATVDGSGGSTAGGSAAGPAAAPASKVRPSGSADTRMNPSSAAALQQLPFRVDDTAAKAVGLENYGNTCYCNSVIQLLYSCQTLRNRCLELLTLFETSKIPPDAEDTVLFRFCELVHQIHKTKKGKKKDLVGPLPFLQKVRRDNPMFCNALQHDAHEFAMFVVNGLIEGERLLIKASSTTWGRSSVVPCDASAASPSNRMVAAQLFRSSEPADSAGTASLSSSTGEGIGTAANSSPNGPTRTPIQAVFEGQFATDTYCMECETKTTRREPFLDLSVELEQLASLRRCIENFSRPEFLMGDDKFRCDACCASNPGRRCMRLQEVPAGAMIIHLKRFKYVEETEQFKKLSWHVALPSELAIHTSDGPEARELLYLKGFVLHQGSGPNIGHYITCIRHRGAGWRKFDDDVVTEISERDIQAYFGIPFTSESASTSTAYILLYERV